MSICSDHFQNNPLKVLKLDVKQLHALRMTDAATKHYFRRAPMYKQATGLREDNVVYSVGVLFGVTQQLRLTFPETLPPYVCMYSSILGECVTQLRGTCV